MKKLLLLLTVIVSVNAFAQLDAAKIKVSLKNGDLSINKNALSKEWRVQPAIEVLGASERSKDGYNKTHTYDNYGIVLFEKSADKVPSGNLAEIQFYFSAPNETNDVTPKGYFTGTFKVQKLTISSDLSAEKLKSSLKDYKNTDSYMEHSYRLSKDGVYIYFQFNNDETRLIKMSLGRDTKG